MKKFLFFVFLLCSTLTFSQEIEGGWTGTLTVKGMELPLVFNFTKTATGYTATMDSPKQGAKGIPAHRQAAAEARHARQGHRRGAVRH